MSAQSTPVQIGLVEFPPQIVQPRLDIRLFLHASGIAAGAFEAGEFVSRSRVHSLEESTCEQFAAAIRQRLRADAVDDAKKVATLISAHWTLKTLIFIGLCLLGWRLLKRHAWTVR